MGNDHIVLIMVKFLLSSLFSVWTTMVCPHRRQDIGFVFAWVHIAESETNMAGNCDLERDLVPEESSLMISWSNFWG